MNNPIKEYVFAGSHKEFMEFCQENNENYQHGKYKYIGDVSVLKGIYPDTIIHFYGTPSSRDDCPEIAREIEMIRERDKQLQVEG